VRLNEAILGNIVDRLVYSCLRMGHFCIVAVWPAYQTDSRELTNSSNNAQDRNELDYMYSVRHRRARSGPKVLETLIAVDGSGQQHVVRRALADRHGAHRMDGLDNNV
jgi:hypothetical protein